MERNTPEAPALPRCDTCGATELDGEGPVTPLNGVLQCGSCTEGALGLVADEPENYDFGPDGRLRRLTPHPGDDVRIAKTAAVDQLLAEIKHRLLDRAGCRAEIFHPRVGVVVLLPGDYRLHIYLPGEGVLNVDFYHGVMFTPDPDRRMIDGFPILGLGATEAIVSAIDDLLDPTTAPGATLAEHRARWAEIAAFNPDDLLRS